MCCSRPHVRFSRRRMRLFRIILFLAAVYGLRRIIKEWQELSTTGSIKDFIRNSRRKFTEQETLDYMAATIKVNLKFSSKVTAEITFTNNGSRAIRNSRWAIYASTHLRFTPSSTMEDNAGVEEAIQIRLTHVNGCLYKFEPGVKNLKISPGESVKCKVKTIPFKVTTRFLVSPNWYIAAEGLKPKTITSTADEEVTFVSFPQAPLYRRISEITPDLGHATLPVVPTPKQVTTSRNSNGKNTKVYISKEWTVSADDRLQNEREFLSDKLRLKESSSSYPKSKVILLVLSPISIAGKFPSTMHESYDLQVDDSKEIITITGQGPAGVYYGVQTLLALMSDKGEVPLVSIKDSPRFSYRGLMIDVARNFQPKSEILKLLDVMAMYKMNKFHFHLSDSEGWRLQIPGLEELTTVGARRCHDLEEKTCILSQFGSGPDTNVSRTGYYSTEDYREILRYAKERHIQVIPEFDFPGHSHAAIKSMIERHDRLAREGRDEESFLLNDLEDSSRYITVQGFVTDAINPCLSSSYKFLDYLLSILVRLHGSVQPLTLFHFGGDEVPIGVWIDSPACKKVTQKFRRNEILVRRYLMENFIAKLSSITNKHGISIGGWSDAFADEDDSEGDELNGMSKRYVLNKKSLNIKNPVAYFWGEARDYWKAAALMEQGYKVVLSPSHILYLDHSSEPSFEERGLNWATGYSDSRKIFEYSPPDNENIQGIEGAMWSELIRTADQMHSMIFPRLLAIAERAWHKASWEDLTDEGERKRALANDWMKFANTLGYRELGRLDKMGLAYHVPSPKARAICKDDNCDMLHVTTELPGLNIEYSTDNGLTWNDVTPEVEVNGRIKLRTRSADQTRFSRVILFEHWKGPYK